MSYFDGRIPTACRGCFRFDGGKWVQNTPHLCDECDFALDMFPVLSPNGKLDSEKLQLLENAIQPDWSI